MIPTRLVNLLKNLDNFKDDRTEFHPERNVGNHLRQCAELALTVTYGFNFALACMLHDIGKNTTDREQLLNHAVRGANMIAMDVPEEVHWLVLNHMRMYDIDKMSVEKRTTLQQHPLFVKLNILHAFDKKARKPDYEPKDWDTLIKEISRKDERHNTVLMMIGIQASGKSTYARQLVAKSQFPNSIKSSYFRTNRDDIRSLLAVGPGEYRYQENVVSKIQQDQIRMALGRGQITIIDNCHNTVRRRVDMINWLRNEFPGLSIKAVVMEAPLDECLARNRREHGSPLRHRLLIPDEVIKQFHSDLVSGFGVKQILGNEIKIEKKLLDEGFNYVQFVLTKSTEQKPNTEIVNGA